MLRAVEAVDFVDEKYGALAEAPPVAGLFEDFAQVLYAGENRGKLLKMQASTARHEPRNRGFASSRRPPENHGARRVAFGDPAQRAALPQEVILADDLAERFRAQPVRKGPRGVVSGGLRALEQRSGRCGSGFGHVSHRMIANRAARVSPPPPGALLGWTHLGA